MPTTPSSRAVSITNELLNAQMTNYGAVLQFVGPILLAERFEPLLARIADALENQQPPTPAKESEALPPTTSPTVFAELLAEEKARTARAIQAGDEVFEKYKEALETIQQLKDRLRIAGLPV